MCFSWTNLRCVVVVLLLVSAGGCGFSDEKVMNRIATELEYELDKAIRQDGYSWAFNIAMASGVFERERQAVKSGSVNVQAPRIRLSSQSQFSPDRKHEIKQLLTKYMHDETLPLGASDAAAYDEVIRKAITPDEYADLQRIRAKYGYWDRLKAAVNSF